MKPEPLALPLVGEPAGRIDLAAAEHTCMTIRGVQATDSPTVTSTLLGTLRDDIQSRQEFFALGGWT
jgi:GTP cyclohydrolase I